MGVIRHVPPRTSVPYCSMAVGALIGDRSRLPAAGSPGSIPDASIIPVVCPDSSLVAVPPGIRERGSGRVSWRPVPSQNHAIAHDIPRKVPVERAILRPCRTMHSYPESFSFFPSRQFHPYEASHTKHPIRSTVSPCCANHPLDSVEIDEATVPNCQQWLQHGPITSLTSGSVCRSNPQRR
jgi:hypothetical protein